MPQVASEHATGPPLDRRRLRNASGGSSGGPSASARPARPCRSRAPAWSARASSSACSRPKVKAFPPFRWTGPRAAQLPRVPRCPGGRRAPPGPAWPAPDGSARFDEHRFGRLRGVPESLGGLADLVQLVIPLGDRPRRSPSPDRLAHPLPVALQQSGSCSAACAVPRGGEAAARQQLVEGVEQPEVPLALERRQRLHPLPVRVDLRSWSSMAGDTGP